VPPRDLRSWQNLPVSAIAHFQPVVLTDLENGSLADALEKTPYQRYPVARDGKLDGILLRKDFEQARTENRPVTLVPAVTARPSQTIRECQILLLESVSGLIVITDTDQGRTLAVVTLHDLLRAQTAISDREG
jgi:CIC family chloride channel protein